MPTKRNRRAVVPLTPEERRKLIEMPITFNVYGKCTYGGTTIAGDVPVRGRRAFVYYPEDETAIRTETEK